MGQKPKYDKLSVQKARIKAIFTNILQTNIEIMRFQLNLTDKEEEQKGLKKFIKESEKAQKIVNGIVHYEILTSLYNTFINRKETYFMAICKTINNKNTTRWDRTQKGFKEFLELEAQARADSKKEYEERLKEQELIKKAKEEGKKVEMVYENGKLKPIIVEEKSN